ncbi:response regulator [Natronospirillum operosum]|uniref:Response regulator n=1 Tax=Natronospirillum operosum TaxID=2759953 RepID=A0A4Z0WBE0_9GAMM|nr:response regulator [Natronospirillum operosum]TGG93233.1 response regulator [Natronospirillum operosum]
MDSNVKAAVLLVDDEAAILSALQRVFRKSGYQIHTAESGEQALDVLTREAVDVVLTDMRMPGMDGSELLQRVRRNWPNVSRVLMTGHADLNQTIRAINEAGIHHYIGKPWDDDELLSVMAEALDRALVYREHQRLLQVTQTQNARLTDLTNALEAKVKARTAELQDVNEKLERTNKSLTRAYRSTIKVLSGHY